MSTPQDQTIVKLMLDRAGLPVSDAELVKLTDGYALQQPAIDAMYRLEATRYEAPCLHFTPTPTFAEWG